MTSRRQRLMALLAPLALFACDRLVSPPETKDRMPPERLARMVYRPVALAEHGDLAAGEDALKALIRPLGTSKDDMIRRADLLTGFAVGLYQAETPNEGLRVASFPYFRRAIAVYETALGPKSPEVALALNSYADAEVRAYDGAVPQDAIDAIARAYAIRRYALGPDNAETRIALRKWKEYRLFPTSTARNADDVDKVTAYLREDIATLHESDSDEAAETIGRTYVGAAVRYRIAGRGEEARQIYDRMLDLFDTQGKNRDRLCHAALEANLAWSALNDDKSANDRTSKDRAFAARFGHCESG